ncbi:hypothetical protein [Clostridium saccharoperbutylacetonicum]|uniref:hypothetical protein n=1 Tax=Clostridium saccharoperbutylacetonicum TaxID=36745 RepID=UPI0039EA1CE5
MVAYVYNKETLKIVSKIYDITFIINNEIYGNEILKLGNAYEYIVLESDTINLDINSIICTDKLEDSRYFFLKSKDDYFNEKLNNQKQLVDSLIETVIHTTLPN